jgi:hypothetical protein
MIRPPAPPPTDEEERECVNSERRFLSLGMGVGSVALMLDMLDDGIDFEAVWVDHGCDWPETRAYADYLEAQGYKFTRLIPDVKGWHNLYEYCIDNKIVPMKQIRWCTGEFKSRPFDKYTGKNCTQYLGITYDERHRAKHKVYKGKAFRYPLVEKHLNRMDAVKIILAHDLDPPPRSNCWFCPFQTKEEVVRLYLTHPDLYDKMKALEATSCRPGRQLFEKPIKSFVPEGCECIESYSDEALQ